MKVVLIENVKGLGKTGDLIDVNDGYARNFLLRLNKAKIATKTEINNVSQKRQSESFHEKQEFEAAKNKFDIINNKEIVILAKKGDGEKLFGSITSKNIAEELSKSYFEVDKKNIVLDSAIKSIGIYHAKVKLYKNLIAKITINVKPE